MKAAKDSPIDKVKTIVKGNYSMLHFTADADVPYHRMKTPYLLRN
jgi:hypothetical protein